MGIGSRKMELTSLPPGVVNDAAPATAAGSGLAHRRDRSFTGGRAERTGVLPDVDGLRAEGDTVERCLVTVLAGHGHLAGEALRFECGDHATGHAVVLDEGDVDGVVLGGEVALHRRLGVCGIPVVGVVLADDGDVTGRNGLTDDLLGATAQEVGVGVGSVALDDHPVARRA